MKNSNLISLLKSFSRDEFEKLGDFIFSPYFNKAVYIRNYFDRIKEFYPGFENFEESKEVTFKSLYPERNYNDATIRKLNSELLKLAEEFLSINSFRDKHFEKNLLLLDELDKRKIDSLFTGTINSVYSFLDAPGLKTEKYFKELMTLNETEFLFFSMRNREKGFPRYIESIENLDKYYIIYKLKKIIIVVGDSKHRKKNIQNKKEIDRFIKSVQNSKFFELPAIQILYNVLMIIWNGSRENFENLKKLFKIYRSEINKEESEWIYFTMINYCIIQNNMGNKEFINEELEIYKGMIKDDLLLYNNAIESDFYKNIIFCAVEAMDFKFAEEFKEEYSKYIFSKDKDYIVSLCNANIAYATKNYAVALEILAKINFTDVQQKFNLRNLSLKIFYENEMYEQAFLGIDSYQQNLKREKTLPVETSKLYTVFIGLYKKLLKIKLSENKGEARMLNSSIRKIDTIAKTWLLRQSENLF